MNGDERIHAEDLRYPPNCVASVMIDDPQPQIVHARLVDEADGPIREEDGFTLVRSSDVVSTLRRTAVDAAAPTGPRKGALRRLIPLDYDGVEHRRYRHLLDPFFSLTSLHAFEPVARSIATRLAGELGRTSDVFASFCEPFPALAFCELVGLPASDLQWLLDFKEEVNRHGITMGSSTGPASHAAQMDEYIRDLLATRATGPSDNTLIGFFADLVADGQLTADEVVDTMYLLVAAGLDTVAASLSLVIAHLALDRRAQARLRAEPAAIPRAVEEVLRFECPVPAGNRWAQGEFKIADVDVRRGDHLQVSWAAANLDEQRFRNATQLDLERDRNPHLSFGSGPHRCLGSHLARLELRIGIETLLERTVDFGPAPESSMHFSNLGVRLVRPLDLVVDPAP